MNSNDTEIEIRDQRADEAVKKMVGTVVAACLVPAVVNSALLAGAMGVGAVAIGHCYGAKLSKDDGAKLMKQFFLAAGTWFVALNIGSAVMAIILAGTGAGYFIAAPLQAAVFGPAAYAIGITAKENFRSEYLGKGSLSKAQIGAIFREAFKNRKQTA